jgi:hypothetical protein
VVYCRSDRGTLDYVRPRIFGGRLVALTFLGMDNTAISEPQDYTRRIVNRLGLAFGESEIVSWTGMERRRFFNMTEANAYYSAQRALAVAAKDAWAERP